MIGLQTQISANSCPERTYYGRIGIKKHRLIIGWGHQDPGMHIESLKMATAPKLTKGFHVACGDLKPARKYVVYAGSDTFQMKEGVRIIPLIQLLNEIEGMKG